MSDSCRWLPTSDHHLFRLVRYVVMSLTGALRRTRSDLAKLAQRMLQLQDESLSLAPLLSKKRCFRVEQVIGLKPPPMLQHLSFHQKNPIFLMEKELLGQKDSIPKQSQSEMILSLRESKTNSERESTSLLRARLGRQGAYGASSAASPAWLLSALKEGKKLSTRGKEADGIQPGFRQTSSLLQITNTKNECHLDPSQSSGKRVFYYFVDASGFGKEG